MDPYEIKENIKRFSEQHNNLKQELIDNITRFTDQLKKATNNNLPRYICANKQPFTLNLTQIKPYKIITDTTNGIKILLEDNSTQFPINNLPIEDLIQLYKRLYYQ